MVEDRVPYDFNRRILDQTAHRPWPMPERPWIMTQTWLDLLFAHWPIAPGLLAAKVPSALPLDLFDGQAWLGIVPFHMRNVAPRGMPALPWLSAFRELNVRTYVRLDDKPGVYFFSLDASNALAVLGARMVFGLPYFSASMQVEVEGDVVRYLSRRRSRTNAAAEFVGTYQPVGPSALPEPGSLEYFLTERYCLYTVDARSRAYRLDIHHPPWPLQAAEAQITNNTMAGAAGIELPDAPPLLHFSKRQDMVGWPMRRVVSRILYP
jgi:hypothetical protein